MTGLEDGTILLRQRLWQQLSATRSVGDPGMSAREINAREKENERAAAMKSSESRVVLVRFSMQGRELELDAHPAMRQNSSHPHGGLFPKDGRTQWYLNKTFLAWDELSQGGEVKKMNRIEEKVYFLSSPAQELLRSCSGAALQQKSDLHWDNNTQEIRSFGPYHQNLSWHLPLVRLLFSTWRYLISFCYQCNNNYQQVHFELCPIC